ncbi:MAG: hypothetical protein ACRDNZ_19815 [Streptosporangiaceae bacterium]
MGIVVTDPTGFAVDWDWQCGLTVWELDGRGWESQFTRKLLEHQLPARPASEGRARRAARQWWRRQGKSQARGR